MKQDNINYLMVGSLVLGAIVVLFVVLLRLTGQHGSSEPYYVTYHNITGIQRGTVVSFGGYPIGQVDDISPVFVDGVTQFKLTLAVQQGWRIPQNSTARIISPGLLSDPQVDIHEGNGQKPLPPGSMLQGREAANLMAAVNNVAGNVQDLTEHNLKPLLDKLSQRIDGIGSRLENVSDVLDKDIPQVIGNVNSLVANLNRSAGQLGELLGDKNQQHVNRLFRNADMMSEKLVGLSKGFDDVVQQLDQMLSHTNNLLASSGDDVRQSIISLRNSLQTVSQNIDAIIYNINNSSRNLNEFSHEIRLNPGALLRGSSVPDNVEGR